MAVVKYLRRKIPKIRQTNFRQRRTEELLRRSDESGAGQAYRWGGPAPVLGCEVIRSVFNKRNLLKGTVKMIKLVVGAFLSIFLSGCAFSVYDVPLNYSYVSTAEAPGAVLPPLKVGEITDSREVQNPRMILNQTNGYGQTTTGGWQAEKNLSEIVHEAVVAGAAKYAASAPDGSQAILLSGELVEVSDQVVSGFWSADLTMRLGVRFTAVDEKTGEIIWRDTIRGEAKSGKGGKAESMITRSFNGAVTNLVDNLFADTYFRQQVERSSPSSMPNS